MRYFWIGFVILAAALIVIKYDRSDKSGSSSQVVVVPKPVAVTAPAHRTTLVPPPFQLAHEFKTVRGRLWHNQYEAAVTVNGIFPFLLQLRGAPELNIDDDEAVWKLIDEYARQTKLLRYSITPLKGKATWYAAMYGCADDMYIIGTNYLTVPELALTMYHEMVHEVDCTKALAAGISRTDNHYWDSQRCDFEEHGYAADVRFMLALKGKGLLWTEVQADPQFQNTYMDAIMQAWSAIADGTFCTWLNSMH